MINLTTGKVIIFWYLSVGPQQISQPINLHPSSHMTIYALSAAAHKEQI